MESATRPLCPGLPPKGGNLPETNGAALLFGVYTGRYVISWTPLCELTYVARHFFRKTCLMTLHWVQKSHLIAQLLNAVLILLT